MTAPRDRTVRLPPPGAAEADVRAAYRNFVRTHHPDRGGDPVVFRAGMEAFERIRNPVAAPAVHRKAEFADVVHTAIRIVRRILRRRRYINLN